ncbi:MAG: isochorismatase family protein [Planctomyces sp.]|nr:isochorismatase family protein [Planctomyces sp.]
MIDLQEKLLPSIPDRDDVVKNCLFLLECCRILGIPASLSEQYPRGLGSTVTPLANHVAVRSRFEKLRFSAAAEFQASANSQLAEPTGDLCTEVIQRHVILCGVEAHICVAQTALELIAAGFIVFVITDAVASRHCNDRLVALERMRSAGCILTTAEAIAFELCAQAGTPEFKALSQLVKAR